MQSGVGERAELHGFGIPVVQHLPGVGQNYQDHPALGLIWESPLPLIPRNTAPGKRSSSGRVTLALTPRLQALPAGVSVLECGERGTIRGARIRLVMGRWWLCARRVVALSA